MNALTAFLKEKCKHSERSSAWFLWGTYGFTALRSRRRRLSPRIAAPSTSGWQFVLGFGIRIKPAFRSGCWAFF
jgi:hypothetical protein